MATALLCFVASLAPASASPLDDVPPGDRFTDVPGQHPFVVPIEWAEIAGVTTGCPDGSFRPVSPVTRQGFAAFLFRLSSPSDPPACDDSGPFVDVPSTHPFCAEIAWLVDAEIAAGFDDGTFRPTNPISRQAMAAFLFRWTSPGASPPPCGAGGPFADVWGTHPFCPEIAWLVDAGLASGFDDGTFRPTNPISRQAAAAFLWRLDGRAGLGATTRVSVASNGEAANADVFHPSISGDGRYVAFESKATNLGGSPNVGVSDIYVHDRVAGTTELVTTSRKPAPTGDSSRPSISADGRYVAFESLANNLTPAIEPTETRRHIFRHDRLTGTTIRLTPFGADAGATEAVISADGNTVAWLSRATNVVGGVDGTHFHVFVRDVAAGTTTIVSRHSNGTIGNNGSSNVHVSGDGRYVMFDSLASNLVPNDTNGVVDVFVRDRVLDTTARISTGNQFPSELAVASRGAGISDDGQFTAFSTAAMNVLPGVIGGVDHLYWRFSQSGLVEAHLSSTTSGANPDSGVGVAVLSGSGLHAAFSSTDTSFVPGGTAGNRIFASDLLGAPRDRIDRVSVSAKGRQLPAGTYASRPSLSGDGRHVAFESNAASLVEPSPASSTVQAYVRTRYGLPTLPG